MGPVTYFLNLGLSSTAQLFDPPHLENYRLGDETLFLEAMNQRAANQSTWAIPTGVTAKTVISGDLETKSHHPGRQL